MKFLWESNAPWAGTGYGQQTKLMLPALAALGHEPICFAFYGLQGGTIEYDGYHCLPASSFESWGNDCVVAHMKRVEADLVITLMDLFVLREDNWKALTEQWPWAAWVPIDCDGIHENARTMLNVVSFPVAMSDFGADQMRRVDVEPFARIYHAVDTDVFRPQDKAECRGLLGLPEDAYIIGMVMANKGNRKQYPLQFEAIRKWIDENPDRDIRVYMHTETTNQMDGWDMPSLVERCGLKGLVYSTDRYDTGVVPVDQEVMSKVFNSFDVLMNCSSGEGFGIPIIEAQACGVPVITHGVTAMPEITQYGYCVESSARDLASHYGYQYFPSVEDMVYRLECVYRMLPDPEQAAATRMWVQENFSVPVIAGEWDEVIRKIEELHIVAEAVPESVTISP